MTSHYCSTVLWFTHTHLCWSWQDPEPRTPSWPPSTGGTIEVILTSWHKTLQRHSECRWKDCWRLSPLPPCTSVTPVSPTKPSALWETHPPTASSACCHQGGDCRPFELELFSAPASFIPICIYLLRFHNLLFRDFYLRTKGLAVIQFWFSVCTLHVVQLTDFEFYKQ